jgi:hypothetical protein
LVVVLRRFFMASLSAAGVPTAAVLGPRYRDYRNTPAASCSPQGQEMASYRLTPSVWKGLGCPPTAKGWFKLARSGPRLVGRDDGFRTGGHEHQSWGFMESMREL